MDKENLKLFIAIFPEENDAEKVIETLKSTGEEELGIQAMLAIHKDQNSKVQYKDVGMTPTKGALGGAVLGAALGILTGGAGLVLGAVGALVGGMTGESKRSGQFSSVRLNEVVASLVPGTSALVAVIDPGKTQEVELLFGKYEAEIFNAEITADLAEKLEDHRHKDFSEWTKNLQS